MKKERGRERMKKSEYEGRREEEIKCQRGRDNKREGRRKRKVRRRRRERERKGETKKIRKESETEK